MSSVLWRLMVVCLSVGGCVVLLGSESVLVFSGTDYAEDQDNYNDNNNGDNGERDHYCYDGGGYFILSEYFKKFH